MRQMIKTTLLAIALSFTSTAFAEIVNINTADLKTLQDNLTGIGEKKAQAIIDYRTEKGGFKTLEEIQEVKGIGPKLFEKIKADLVLTETPSASNPNPTPELSTTSNTSNPVTTTSTLPTATPAISTNNSTETTANNTPSQ
jgi:competence protein ComEA